MSLSGAHRAAFRREATRARRIFTIRDSDGYPAPMNAAGQRAVPFWSRPTRAQRVLDLVAAYQGFEVRVIDLDDWLGGWLPCLGRDGIRVGVNWAGARATGFDLTPAEVAEWFAEPAAPMPATSPC